MSDIKNWKPQEHLSLTMGLNRRHLGLPRLYVELKVDGAILSLESSDGEKLSIFLPDGIRLCRLEEK